MDVETLNSWSQSSALVASRIEVERAFKAIERTPVTPEQIEALTRAGNDAENWAQVLVPRDFDPGRIVGCRFEGRVELGDLRGERLDRSGDRIGLFHSTFRDCQVDDGVSISRCGRVDRVFVGRGAVLEGVGRLCASGESSRFGNDLELFAEPLYSRRLRAVAELPFDWAVRATGSDGEGVRPVEFEKQLFFACEAYADRFQSSIMFVGPGVQIRATVVVENCWIGEGVTIDGAGTLRNSTVWSERGATTLVADGAEVHDSMIGPGCTIRDQSLVRGCLLVETVSVGDQAIVKRSLIGPNARLGECEINDSFLGPFVTALHHSLVIAAWWPEGRGNIGYGANVGSNHTGRAPDQEIWPGEGVFFGLGCNIKLPSNFRGAPYTLIATGADTLPQKVEFPFSLISKPSMFPEDINRTLTEIQPGWSLAHNAYGLERQERNQRSRNRAARTELTTFLFRSELAPLLETARARLVEGARDHGDFYTSEQIQGIGRSFMSEAARRKGVEAYAFGLSLIASRSLLRSIDALEPDPGSASAREAVARALRFAGPMFGSSEPESLIKASLRIERDWLERVMESKSRDDRRGRQVLDDYAERHVEAKSDPLILALSDELESRRGRIETMIRIAAGIETGATGSAP